MNQKKSGLISRRNFLASGTAALIMSVLNKISFAGEENSAFKLPPLPYSEKALEPYISSKTIKLHYNNHHKKYVAAVAAKAKGTSYEKASLEKIIKETYGSTELEYLHLMAVLAWNHDFYWKSMKPQGGGEVPATLKEKIEKSFGSIDNFKTKFKESAMTPGSGWTWLVMDGENLRIKYTTYHESPLTLNLKPLITLDCWEHAYYLDYQDEKEKYIDAFLNNLINWSFAEGNLK
ncbi:MAG: superoxide dismutase [Chitinispirillaceae bacterium]|nr:superoxide dismutase [Chitinispirillaceae bacterium]